MFKVKFQNMNRMNLLFYKAFLAPSKNHANHCKKLLYKLNKNAVKSQTALLYPLHNERHDMNMNTTKPAFTRNDLELETAIDLLENLVNSINGDAEMLSYDQDQAHAFLEAYFKHQQENEVAQ